MPPTTSAACSSPRDLSCRNRRATTTPRRSCRRWAGPAPKPCCDWYLDTAGWAHGADCTLQPALERFPLAGPRQPLVTQPGSRWGYLNKGASCG
jgi:hypothetical protein